MSLEKTNFLREHRLRLLTMGYSHTQLIVLDEVAYAEGDGLGFPCWSSTGRIAREAGVDRSYVSKTLKKAASDRVLLEDRHPRASKYAVVGRRVNLDLFEERVERINTSKESCQVTRQESCPQIPRPVVAAVLLPMAKLKVPARPVLKPVRPKQTFQTFLAALIPDPT